MNRRRFTNGRYAPNSLLTTETCTEKHTLVEQLVDVGKEDAALWRANEVAEDYHQVLQEQLDTNLT